MRRNNLTKLVESGNFISGLYNYCDRWCERCPLTSRCLVYASEMEDDATVLEDRDSINETFWSELASNLEEARALIASFAEEAGIDLQTVEKASTAETDDRFEDVMQDELSTTAKHYADEVERWFAELDQIETVSDLHEPEAELEEAEQIDEARDVIYWYQYQIAVKIVRALMSLEDDVWARSDADGSAKVALIAIDRSISAWRALQLRLPEWAETIIAHILSLERLRLATEHRFPNARDFIRPGFDEILGAAN